MRAAVSAVANGMVNEHPRWLERTTYGLLALFVLAFLAVHLPSSGDEPLPDSVVAGDGSVGPAVALGRGFAPTLATVFGLPNDSAFRVGAELRQDPPAPPRPIRPIEVLRYAPNTSPPVA